MYSISFADSLYKNVPHLSVNRSHQYSYSEIYELHTMKQMKLDGTQRAAVDGHASCCCDLDL